MKPVYAVKRMDTPDWSVVPAVELRHTGWLEPCPIEAKAQLCWDRAETLWVRLEAKEAPIRATLTGKLDPVCSDSCLEFFLAPWPEDARYFNFEFNPLGTLYLGYGAERSSRVRQIVKDPEGIFAPAPYLTEDGWGIVFRVPLSFLRVYDPAFSFGTELHANFYKCGDLTETPHYLAWSPLSCDTPDYHRRQDFGVLRLEL